MQKTKTLLNANKTDSIAILILLFGLFISGCSSTYKPTPSEEIWDPFEPVNRVLFNYNDFIYEELIKPTADAYDYITPKAVQTGIGNFFSNLRYPIFLLSDITQLKFKQAGVHTARFAINSTLGLGGLIDVAKNVDIKHHEEDFGITLGYWGVPAGPYIVLPLLGPSNLRDVIGKVVDYAANPLNYHYYFDELDELGELYVAIPTTVIPALNSINSAKKAIKSAKSASIDYYLFAQGAYHQMRNGLITDGTSSAKDEFDDSFDDFEDEFDDWEDNEEEAID